MNKAIAFFDFDGTITTKDTLIEFTKFVVGDIKFLFGFTILSPIMVLFKLKLIPNHKAKEIFLSYFFKGLDKEYFNEKAKEYSLNMIDTILREKAIKKINWHKSQKHKVVVVSASLEDWLKPWCEKNGLELLSTKFDIDSGKFISKNCHGIQKVNRIKKSYNLREYTYVYAYGDSSGDKEMLELANEKFYKPFVN